MSKLVVLLILIILVLMLLLMALIVGAAPIAFVNSWTKNVGDGSAPIGESQSITVATNASNTITVFVATHDCDTSVGIDFTIADNAGNTYVRQFQTKRINCGTVDIQALYWTSVSANPATTIYVNRTGGTINGHFVITFIVQSYNNVAAIGNKNSGSQNSGFPEMFTTATVNTSWVVGYVRTFQTVAMPPGGYNEGRFRASASVGAENVPIFGSDNNEVDNATSGGGRVCAVSEMCIYPNLSGVISFTWYIVELVPPINPVVSTLPATELNFSTAILNGNLSDIGVGPNVIVFFFWGDTASLGNQTPSQTVSAPTLFSFKLGGLTDNHTYFFKAHAENAANASISANGTTLSFTTPLNTTIRDFGNYGWVFGFIATLCLGLWGAYWIKKKREEH